MRKHNSESVSKKHLARNISERTSKRRGELAELAFLWKAASLGFTVAKPYGDSDRYDFIVDSGGRLIRVQVKSASRLSHGTYFITTQRCRNGVAIPEPAHLYESQYRTPMSRTTQLELPAARSTANVDACSILNVGAPFNRVLRD